MSMIGTITTVAQLVEDGVIESPIDGNHGELHPKRDDFVEEGIPFLMASDIESSYIDFCNIHHSC